MDHQALDRDSSREAIMKTDVTIMKDGRRAIRKRCGSGTIYYPLRNEQEGASEGRSASLGSRLVAEARLALSRLSEAVRRSV